MGGRPQRQSVPTSVKSPLSSRCWVGRVRGDQYGGYDVEGKPSAAGTDVARPAGRVARAERTTCRWFGLGGSRPVGFGRRRFLPHRSWKRTGCGRSSRYRAVDAPASQDVPAWDGACVGPGLRVRDRRTGPTEEQKVPQSLSGFCGRRWKECGFDSLLAKSATQLACRRSAAVRAAAPALRPSAGSLQRRE